MVVGNPLIDLFGKSPVRPIQEHMQKVQAGTLILPKFVREAQKGDWKEAESLQKEIVAKEREADKLKHSVRTHLPKRLFMPVSRGDLIELVTTQDRIINCTKDVAGLMLGRKIRFPKVIFPLIRDYLKECIGVSAATLRAIETLDEVFGAGFGRREVRQVDSLIKEISKLEKRTDKQQIKIRGQLFKIEESLPPVEVMFLYTIIELIGDIADYAERASNRLQILIST